MISIATAAAQMGLSRQRVALLCKQRRIPGARLLGRIWAIPEAFEILPGKVRGPGKPKPLELTDCGRAHPYPRCFCQTCAAAR